MFLGKSEELRSVLCFVNCYLEVQIVSSMGRWGDVGVGGWDWDWDWGNKHKDSKAGNNITMACFQSSHVGKDQLLYV